MSSSFMPEVLRKAWYALSVGNDAFFWSANELLTSASETLMPCLSASCWTHADWIRNCMTSRLSVSYSV